MLIKRLEKIDMRLAKHMNDQIGKKRTNTLLFKAHGKMSVYKCFSKGIEYDRIVDYLVMNETKMRI